MIQPEPFETRLVAARNLTPGVRELVFERMDGKAFHHEAGQWVNLVLPLPTGEIKRAYSIASAPSGSSRFELAVTRVAGGPGSEYLHALEVGSMLRAIGPHGLFTRDPSDPSPALFVATGTGVTPLRSMLHAARRAGSMAPIWILFGARFEEDILYREELEALASDPGGTRERGVPTHVRGGTRECGVPTHVRGGTRERGVPTHVRGGIRYEVTLSQGGPAWAGRRGYVQTHVGELYRALISESSGAEPHVYICGLDRMVHAVRELARKELGIDRKRVHIERYD